jgi:tRNA pseudouridine-54 N-methylase
LVNFLLLLEKITQYNKKIIDKGLTPQKIYELCSCIRETFCLSYSIRKDNNLLLYFQNEHILVSFIGEALRYLGPDERSQALLLEKALNKANRINFNVRNGRKQSTPGIYVLKFLDHPSFLGYINSLVIGNVYVITDKEEFIKKERDIYTRNINFEFFIDRNLFIIPMYEDFIGDSKILDLFKEMKNIKFFSLSKIKLIENKILYINYRKDHQESVRL